MFKNKFNLVCVLGGSPAVVTEMLYGFKKLANGQDHFIPKKIYLLTTKAGLRYEKLIKQQIAHFLKCYQPKSEITPEQSYVEFIVPTDEKGEMINDVSSEEEERFFDIACHHLIVSLSTNSRLRTFASIAGGRKMMALSLVNAIQVGGSLMDKVFTVHIPPEIESYFGFFFPIPYDAECQAHMVPELDRATLEPKMGDKGRIKLIDASKIDFDIAEKRVIKYGPKTRAKVLTETGDLNELYEFIELANFPQNIALEIDRPVKNKGFSITISNILTNKSYQCALRAGGYMMMRLLADQTIRILQKNERTCLITKPVGEDSITPKDRVTWIYQYIKELMTMLECNCVDEFDEDISEYADSLKSWDQIVTDGYSMGNGEKNSSAYTQWFHSFYTDIRSTLNGLGLDTKSLFQIKNLAEKAENSKKNTRNIQLLSKVIEGEIQCLNYSATTLSLLKSDLQTRFSEILAECLLPIVCEDVISEDKVKKVGKGKILVLPFHPDNISIA